MVECKMKVTRSFYNKFSFALLCQHIYMNISDRRKYPLLLLVGGCSRSGKSALVSKLYEYFKAMGFGCRIVSLDSWLISVEERSFNSTVLERYDCSAITASMNEILKGNDIFPPIYDPVSRRRIAQKSQEPISAQSGIVIAEGVVALAIKELTDIAPVRIFVTVNDKIRMERLKEFYTKIKGMCIIEAEKIIQSREIEEVPFIKKTLGYANFIYTNDK